MNNLYTSEKLPSFCFAINLQTLPLSIVGLVVVLACGAGHAWSSNFMDDKAKYTKLTPTSGYSSLRSKAVSCIPLLKSIRQTSAMPAMDRSQRNSGKVAALGLMLGARYINKPHHAASGSSNYYSGIEQAKINRNGKIILSIMNYRTCLKNIALNSSET